MSIFRRSILYILMLLLCFTTWARNERDTLGVGTRMTFSENLGQWDDQILFRSQMKAATLFLEKDRFTIVVQHPDNSNLHHHPALNNEDKRYRQHAYQVLFVGAKTQHVEGGQKHEDYENYFIGKDRRRWKGGVGIYDDVNYRDLYPGIDLKVYSAANAMKYDFIVAPGANPSDICMRYEGVDGTRLQNGNIVVKTSVLDIVELRPYAYQMVDGHEVEVEARYILKNDEARIQVGRYDATRPLIIDPYLYFSTYTGSTSDNWGTTAAYDAHKNVYTSGVSFFQGYPYSLGAFDSTYNGNADVGIFVFSPDGSQRRYATYLGGNYGDMPHSLFVNDLDELVIFGTTGSDNFPTTPTAYDTSFNGGTPIQYESNAINYPNGSDIFVSRFSNDGRRLLASTYVGGAGNDGLNYENYYNANNTLIMLGNDSLYYNYGDGARGELITDDLANIYVGSTTKSANFPVTSNSFRPFYSGGQDGVVFKLDYNLSNLLWSSYIGGYGDDAVYSIDVDNEYNLLVCGGTNSINFPTTSNAYNTSYNGGSADGFIAKISYHGNMLMASTLFGSSSYDQCYFVRTGKRNDAFVFGQTTASGTTLVHNATYNTPNSGQFLARFTPELDSLIWSTVFGTGSGEPNISPTAFAADVCDRVYAAGWGRKFCGYYLAGQTIPWNTYGTWGMPITPDAYQSTTDGQDFYVFSIDDAASQQVYGSFFGEIHGLNDNYGGTDHVDGGTSRFDRCATLYQSVCASCGGTDAFPTTAGVWSTTNNASNCNNAVFRLNVNNDFPVADFVQPPTQCAPVFNYQFEFTGRADRVQWTFGDGSAAQTIRNGSFNVRHTYLSPGMYTVRLVAYMDTGCCGTDTIEHQILVLGNRSSWLDTLSVCPGNPIQIGLTPTINSTYRWITGAVSDSTIANPYCSSDGHYTLLVSNITNSCVDTVHQIVTLGHANFSITGDTASCSSPLTFAVNCQGSQIHYFWSHHDNFSDTINTNTLLPNITIDLDTSMTLYVHVVDQLGCEETDSIHVRFYSVVDTLITTPTSCPDNCDGTITSLSTGFAVRPYSYACDNTPLTDSVARDLCPGDHTMLFTDANGCHVEKHATIVAPPQPTVSATVTHVPCRDGNTGAIQLAVSGNAPPYTFLWADDSSTSNSRSQLTVGLYIVTITDSNGCHFDDTVEVRDMANLSVEAQFISNTCEDDCSGRASAIVTGGTAPFSYAWSNGETTSDAEHLCDGTSHFIVTDANGCVEGDSVFIDTQHSFADVNAWADTDVVFINGSTGLHVTTIPNGSYSWYPAGPLDNASSPNPVATLTDTTIFVVTVTDSVGCTYNDTVRVCCINVNCGEENIFIPNAFTPNDDGKNDQLCFRGEWVREFYIAIFTRWGEMVYESHDINACWDGRYKNNLCLPGVYTYYCKVSCEAGMENQFKGDITLIR